MASNFFGQIFRITTFGESHGKGIGVVIDGVPSGLEITEDEINHELFKRKPGKTHVTSPRKEPDRATILSGVFQSKTTGAPLTIWIENQDIDSSKYEPIKEIFRPGHANYTYFEKYAHFDPLGGGRSSARETAARVAAGAVAKKFLAQFDIQIISFIRQIGSVLFEDSLQNLNEVKEKINQSPVFCPCDKTTVMMIQEIENAQKNEDSVGGLVETQVYNLPAGLGDPMYFKLEAVLAFAMLSIPASRGFEIGQGFSAVSMRGSQHNDLFYKNEQNIIKTLSNHSGGTLGGISSGMPLIFKVPFKPTSSIKKPQPSINQNLQEEILHLPPGSRHDPCVAIRATTIVEAMTALVLADTCLMARVTNN